MPQLLQLATGALIIHWNVASAAMPMTLTLSLHSFVAGLESTVIVYGTQKTYTVPSYPTLAL